MSLTPVEPPPRNRSRRPWVIGCLGVVFISTVVASVAVWRFQEWARTQPGPSLRYLGIPVGGWNVIDSPTTSPGGTHDVRILITDGGATGYGGIEVYQWDRAARKWVELDSAAPAVAERESLRSSWRDENTLEVEYENPREGPVKTVISMRF